jgi:hypothetical protein
LPYPVRLRYDQFCGRIFPLATKNQRTATCHFLPCLTDGVQSIAVADESVTKEAKAAVDKINSLVKYK